MQIEPGGVYLVDLQLSHAEQLGPSWLVGAFAAAYPGADVVSVDEHGPDRATVRIRWRAADGGQISAGQTMGGIVQGVTIPGEAVPKASVESVRHTGETMPSLEQAAPAELRIALAGAILVATWYLTTRIKRSHGGSKTAGTR